MGWLDALRPRVKITFENGEKFYEYKFGEDGQYSYEDKVNMILSNPAAIYVFDLICDLFSLGVFKMYRGEQEVESDPLLDFLDNPNPFQNATQFKYDYLFYRKFGTANLYTDIKTLGSAKPNGYFLFNGYMKWPKWFTDNKASLLDEQLFAEAQSKEIEYRMPHKTRFIPYENITQFFDITNGTNRWDGPSRVDALVELVKNSDKALKAIGRNADFAGKYLVGSQVDIEQTDKLPLGQADKASIREAMKDRNEFVYPTKTPPSIIPYSDGTALPFLDEAFYKSMFYIGKVLNIPRDVLEVIDGSTYENQEKARALIIYYVIQPAANDFCDGLLRHFGYEGYTLELDYSHLPFLQVMETDKAEVFSRKAEALKDLIEAGMNPEDAADYLGIPYSRPFNQPIRTGRNE